MLEATTQAFTFAPAIGPATSVTAPDTAYGPTGKEGPPTVPGVVVGALGSNVRPLPQPASSSAMETPSASCVVIGAAIGDMQPLLDRSERPSQPHEPQNDLCQRRATKDDRKH